MKIRQAARVIVVAAVVATAASAEASTQTECVWVYQQTGVNCSTTVNCSQPIQGQAPGDNCDVTVNCQPTYGQVEHCSQAEVPTTPVPVFRFYNGREHLYSTQSSPPAGYWDEGEVFSLANDSYLGAVAFHGLYSGQGYLFPTNDSEAISSVAGLTPLYIFYNPTLGDTFFTVNPSDVNAFPCIPAGCNYDPATNICYGYPPNCYEQGGVYGLVGR